jgi:hypothetical protein
MSITWSELERRLPSKPFTTVSSVLSKGETIDELIVSNSDRQALLALQTGLLFVRWPRSGALKVAAALVVPIAAIGVLATTHKSGVGHLSIKYSEIDELFIRHIRGGRLVEARTNAFKTLTPQKGTWWEYGGRPNHWNALLLQKRDLAGQETALEHIRKLVIERKDGSLLLNDSPIKSQPPDLVDQLERLSLLKSQGSLSNEEFSSAKKNLLSENQLSSNSGQITPETIIAETVSEVEGTDDAGQDKPVSTFDGMPRNNGFLPGWYKNPRLNAEGLCWWEGTKWDHDRVSDPQ